MARYKPFPLKHNLDPCRLLYKLHYIMYLLPTGSEEREVLGVGSIPVAILPSS